MAVKYNIKLVVSGDTENLEITEAMMVKWLDTPLELNVRQRALMMRIVRMTCLWLKANGGTELEITEVEI